MDENVLAWVNKYGLNVFTLLLVFASFFKKELQSLFQNRLNITFRRQQKQADLESKAWERVLGNGERVKHLYDRLLLQQENYMAATRERDKSIERFTSAAVEAMRDAAKVMARTIGQFERTEKTRTEQMNQIARMLDAVSERMAGIGIILGLYLHDKQGADFDALIESIRKSTGDS